MNRDDELIERADELDRLIEEQRARGLAGDATSPLWAESLLALAGDLDGLRRGVDLPDADATWERLKLELTPAREDAVAESLEALSTTSAVAGLDALARDTALPDEDAVWERVMAGMSARDASGSRRRVRRLLGHRLVLVPLGAAAAALVAVVLTLAQPPTNTAEAFVRDVEALSNLTQQALADGVLSPEEKELMAERSAALRLAVDQRPEVLIELDPASRGRVLATLASVTERLTPIADQELETLRQESRGAGVDSNAATTVGPAAAGDAVAQTSATVVGTAGGPQASPASGASGLPADSNAEEPPGLQVAPVVASSVSSLREVAERVNGSAGGKVTAPGQAATPGYLAGLCRGLRGSGRGDCQRAINAAIAACSGAADRGALDDCGVAVDSASVVCTSVLSADEAKVCAGALAQLRDGGELDVAGVSSGTGDHGNGGPPAGDGEHGNREN